MNNFVFRAKGTAREPSQRERARRPDLDDGGGDGGDTVVEVAEPEDLRARDRLVRPTKKGVLLRIKQPMQKRSRRPHATALGARTRSKSADTLQLRPALAKPTPAPDVAGENWPARASPGGEAASGEAAPRSRGMPPAFVKASGQSSGTSAVSILR